MTATLKMLLSGFLWNILNRSTCVCRWDEVLYRVTVISVFCDYKPQLAIVIHMC